MDETTPPSESGGQSDPAHGIGPESTLPFTQSPPSVPGPVSENPLGPTAGPGTPPSGSAGVSPLRRHPVRWTLAAAGLAAILAVGGYGVTQAVNPSTSGSAAAAVTGGVGSSSGAAGGPPGRGSGSGTGGTAGGHGATGMNAPGGKRGMPPGRGSGTVGKVTAVSTDSITVTTIAKKAVTVTVSASTVYKDGSTTSTRAALKVGDVAMVTGSTASDGTVTATTVRFGTALAAPPGA